MSGSENGELLAVFLEEASEGVARLSVQLLELESSEGEARERTVRELFRLAHTLKGSASAVGRNDISEVAHSLEAVLEAVRRGALAPGRALVDASLSAVDALQRSLTRALTAAEVEAARARLDAVRPASSHASLPAGGLASSLARAAGGELSLTGDAPEQARGLLQALLSQLGALSRDGSSEGRQQVAGTLAGLTAVGPRVAGVRFAQVCAQLVASLSAALSSERPAGGALEGALLAADFLHSELDGRGSDEEAELVLSLLGTAQPAPEAPAAQLLPTPLAPSPAPVAGALEPGVPESEREGSVRVPVALLDELLYRLDELVAARLRVDHQRRQVEEVQEAAEAALVHTRQGVGDALGTLELVSRRLESVRRDLTQEVHALGILAQSLQDDVRDVRMVTLGPLLDGYRRMVRELAYELGKEALLEVTGGEVRLDKRLVNILREALVHLLRNALDHGLEPPAERQALGKAPRGRLTLSAEAREGQLWLTLEDDGRGVDTARVRRVAVQKGLVDAERAALLSEQQACELIFLPGFSTQAHVTQTSGRGVGLDVVRENVGRQGGRVELTSHLGRGTRFTLVLPLTVATSGGLVVSTGRHTYCLPLTLVQEVVAVEPHELGLAQGRLGLQRHGQLVPFVQLDDVLAGRASPRPSRHGWAVLLALGERRLALGVEGLLGQEELVVKALVAGTPPLPFVAGAASLSDGRLVAVLEPEALLSAAAGLGSSAQAASSSAAGTVLVADDSLTTRTLVAGVLQRAGYRVLTAPDGEAAWGVLQRERVDLVCSDVEMPHLDGVGLVARMRSKGLTTPLILITSLDAQADRERGARAGATRYIVKQEFDPPAFLGLVRELLQGAGG